ncbi:MAG: peptidylprolyl isomerase [Smithellaceae bacterium]
MIGEKLSNGFALRSRAVLLIILLMLAISNTAGAVSKPAPGDVLARWENNVITNNDLDQRISQYPPDVQAKLKDPAQRKQFLESLVQVHITGAEARARRLDKKKTVAVRIDDAVDSILAQEYIQEKIKTLKTPTEKEIAAFYEANKSNYLTPVSIRAQHILIETKNDAKPEDVTAAEARAKKVYDELVAGGNFEKLAEKYSDDKENKTKGGDLGFFNAQQMVPEFFKPVSGMKKNELSKPFRTPFGFHVVKINDLIPAKQMEFKDVKEDAKLRLENQNREQLIHDELERLKKKYKVKMY